LPFESLPNGSGSESGDIDAQLKVFWESFHMLPSKTENYREEAKLPQSALGGRQMI
jgi:hypothetical protein